MNKLIEYENGLKVVVYNIPGVRSVSCGYWVGVGSGNETAQINGLSHFTEHMMFKGTKDMTPFDIANAFESLGANVNAFTSKECTCYYVKSVDEYSEKCFELLSKIMFESTFDKGELDKERKVIVEEINMVEDSPEDICYDYIASAVFGNEGLGQTILGPIDNVLRFNGDDIREHLANFYVPSNMVIAFSGNITIEQADALVRKYTLSHFTKQANTPSLIKNTFNKRIHAQRIKDFEQSNIALSFPSIPFGDDKAIVQTALNVCLGGGMSSRLFQSVREQRGLAYSVYSAPSAYRNIGTFNIFLNISEVNTLKALEAVKEELDNFKRNGITQVELERTKVQLKSSVVFAGENVQSIMTACGKLMLLDGKLYDIDERIRQIDAITKKDIDDFANFIFDYSNLNSAYVGKKTDVDVLGVFDKN